MSPVPAIDISPEQWAIVESVLDRHVPAHEVWAFGSRAKWSAKPYSDLDLCVVSEHSLGLDLRAALADDFAQSDLPWKVDVVDWAVTSEAFRNIIQASKAVLRKGSSTAGQPGDSAVYK